MVLFLIISGLLGCVFFGYYLRHKNNRKTHRVSAPKTITKPQFVCDYESIVDVFRKKDMFFQLVCQINASTNVELLFAIGMYQKLQLVSIKSNNEEVWTGRLYLEIGGPSKQYNYFFNSGLFQAGVNPSNYLYKDSNGVASLNKGFSLNYTIDRNLQKKLSVFQYEVECDWFHVAKENIEVSLFQKIKESAVLIDGGESLSVTFFDKQTIARVKEVLVGNSFGVLLGDTICEFSLDISSNYKVSLVGSQDFHDHTGNVDKNRLERYLKENLYSDCQMYLDEKVGVCCGYKDTNAKYQKISLSTQKASFGMTKFGNYRALMSISTAYAYDNEEFRVKFIPQKILNKDILIVWKTSL